MPQNKRKASSMGVSAQQKAIFANSRFSKLHPWPSYGAARVKRGTPFSLEMFGPTMREANALQRDARLNSGFTGRGAYWGKMLGGKAGSYLGSKIGIGSIGNQVGSFLGDKASDYIEGLFGRGAYTTNNLINPGQHNRQIATVQDESGDFIFSHTEFLTSIIPSSSGFESQFTCNINPGLSDFAPMLSQIAQYFEEYEMIQLIFHYKSTVTDGNNLAAGTVLTATQYNPTNADFGTEQLMDNYEHASRTKVTQDMLHAVECDPAKLSGTQSEYIRTGQLPQGQDLKTYDLAKFQLATVGASPGLNIGRLYVTYKVRLSKMKQVVATQNVIGTLIPSTIFLLDYASANFGNNGAIFDGTKVPSMYNVASLPAPLFLDNNTISPNNTNLVGNWNGNYKIIIDITLAAAAQNSTNVLQKAWFDSISTTNSTIINTDTKYWCNGCELANTTAANSRITVHFGVSITDNNWVIVLPLFTKIVSNGIVNSSLFLMKINDNLF